MLVEAIINKQFFEVNRFMTEKEIKDSERRMKEKHEANRRLIELVTYVS